MVGLYTAHRIHEKKEKNDTAMCGRAGCDKVLHSSYTKIGFLKLEYLGILFFSLNLIFHTVALYLPTLYTGFSGLLYRIFMLSGFGFSLYLIYIQGFILRAWCRMCMLCHCATATLCIGVLYFFQSTDTLSVLALYRTPILVVHGLAGAVAVGATVVTDSLFFRFLKDYKITQKEKEIMDGISSIIWVALGVLILTGFGIFIPQSAFYLASAKFMAKVSIVAVIFLNGILLNLYLSPNLIRIVFYEKDRIATPSVRVARRIAYASGVVSIISWCVVFVLGSLKSIYFSYEQAMFFYGTVIFFAIAGSQIMERYVSKNGIPEID
jgi:uncharacterized membrane protein